MTTDLPAIKDRILDAALEEIVEIGLHRVTYRSIAARARLSPGSLTYHYADLDEIFAAAFQKMYVAMAAEYRQRFEMAHTVQEAVEAVVNLIAPEATSEWQTRALFEMYSYGGFNSTVRDYCGHWMELSRQSLQLHFPEHTARALDALHEGWSMHRYFERRELDPTRVRAVVWALAQHT